MSRDSDLNEIKYEKSPDYMTAYSDGVIIQLGDEVSRLMFYQVDADLSDISNNVKENKILRFEVRMPKDVLRQVAETIVNTVNAQDEAFEAVDGIENEEINQKQVDLDNKLNITYFDPQIQLVNPNKNNQLQDELVDLIGRANREKGIDTTDE